MYTKHTQKMLRSNNHIEFSIFMCVCICIDFTVILSQSDEILSFGKVRFPSQNDNLLNVLFFKFLLICSCVTESECMRTVCVWLCVHVRSYISMICLLAMILYEHLVDLSSPGSV